MFVEHVDMAGLGLREMCIVSLSSSSVNSGTFASSSDKLPLTGGYLTSAGASFPGSVTRYVVGMHGRLDIFLKKAPRLFVMKPVAEILRRTVFSSFSLVFLVSFITPSPFLFISTLLVSFNGAELSGIALQLFDDVGRDSIRANFDSAPTVTEEVCRTTLVAGRLDPGRKTVLEKLGCKTTGCKTTGCRTLFVIISCGASRGRACD